LNKYNKVTTVLRKAEQICLKKQDQDKDKMTVATLAAWSETPVVLRLIVPYIGREMPLAPQRNFKFHKTQEFRDCTKHHTA